MTRAYNRYVHDTITDLISDVMEKAVVAKQLEREDVDRFYLEMSRIGYRDLGFEPLFGRPWYRKSLPQGVSKLKAKIRHRYLVLRKAREINNERREPMF